MEKQPGGFDSHEISEELFASSDSPVEYTAFKEEGTQVPHLLKEMADKYAEKLYELSNHVDALFSKMINTENEEELGSLEKEFKTLNDEYVKLHALVMRVEDHVYGEKREESLN